MLVREHTGRNNNANDDFNGPWMLCTGISVRREERVSVWVRTHTAVVVIRALSGG